MAINSITASAQSIQAIPTTEASTTGGTKPAATTKTTAKKDDTADFIDRAEKLILDPKSSTDDIMKFLKKESAGGKLNEEEQLALQELFQSRRQTNDLISNVFRMLADAALNVIRNIH
jgi:hypothetical protein